MAHGGPRLFPRASVRGHQLPSEPGRSERPGTDADRLRPEPDLRLELLQLRVHAAARAGLGGALHSREEEARRRGARVDGVLVPGRRVPKPRRRLGAGQRLPDARHGLQDDRHRLAEHRDDGRRLVAQVRLLREVRHVHVGPLPADWRAGEAHRPADARSDGRAGRGARHLARRFVQLQHPGQSPVCGADEHRSDDLGKSRGRVQEVRRRRHPFQHAVDRRPEPDSGHGHGAEELHPGVAGPPHRPRR